jgi:hypothetical protein
MGEEGKLLELVGPDTGSLMPTGFHWYPGIAEAGTILLDC